VKHRVPNPLSKEQYSDSVATDSGSIYYARGTDACGQNVKLMRFDIGSTDPVVVSSVPSKFEIWSTWAFTDSTGADQVYFRRGDCNAGRYQYYSDIYVTHDADTAASAQVGGGPASHGPKQLRELGAGGGR
jgi:hypothetical protein